MMLMRKLLMRVLMLVLLRLRIAVLERSGSTEL